MRRLVLFDIDGTLITDSGAARDAFAAALAAVYGFDGSVERYDFSGRTDPEIALMILRDIGLSEPDVMEKMPALWEHYLDGLRRNANGDRVRALPGIAPLLQSLEQHPDVTLALLTGNIEPGARIKLTSPDLNRYFPFGAFGSDSPRRSELPPIAVQRASAHNGHQFQGRDVVIIGDSIYDVRCGVPHDATTIAIASGKTSLSKLKAENPHHLFGSADEPGLLEAILI